MELFPHSFIRLHDMRKGNFTFILQSLLTHRVTLPHAMTSRCPAQLHFNYDIKFQLRLHLETVQQTATVCGLEQSLYAQKIASFLWKPKVRYRLHKSDGTGHCHKTWIHVIWGSYSSDNEERRLLGRDTVQFGANVPTIRSSLLPSSWVQKREGSLLWNSGWRKQSAVWSERRNYFPN